MHSFVKDEFCLFLQSQQQVNSFDYYLNEISVQSHDEQGNNVLWKQSKAEFYAIVGLCTHDEAYRIQRQKSTRETSKGSGEYREEEENEYMYFM